MPTLQKKEFLQVAAVDGVMLLQASSMQGEEAQAYLWHACHAPSDPEVIAKQEAGLRNECAVQE